MPEPVPWIEAFAAQRGLRYEPDCDERWLRAWEPYTTLKVPIRYEHALSATGGTGSISIARAVVELHPVGQPVRATSAVPNQPAPLEVGTWIAIVQDVRVKSAAATTSDFGGVFGEPLDLVTLPRKQTGESQFDNVFATFSKSTEEARRAVNPSLRRLLLSWRSGVHAEMRPGGFILAPVTVTADDRGLAWMLSAVHLFGEKATKLPSATSLP